jgi:hypothetical protein
MQPVSQAWKDNHNKTIVNEGYVEINFKITDPDASMDATAIDNGHLPFSDTNSVVSNVEKSITPYATLELNQWLLDGSRRILPDDNYDEVGFVGNTIGKIDGSFSANPIITINFSQVHTNMLQGVTIKWCEFLKEYAKEFVITAYNGSTVVASKTISDNSSVLSVVEIDMSGYDRITIEVVKWSIAEHRARIDEIFIGVNKIYDKKNIFSYSSSQTVDPISAELPKSEISFSVDNVNGAYNPLNTEGLSKYLIKRQSLTVKYGYKMDDGSIEWIKGGVFYLSEWDAEQNGLSAEFTARDLLEFMTGTYYYGVYNPNGTSLYNLALSVLQDANLPLNEDGSVKWVIDESLKNLYTVAPLPIDTHANCLQMIANAGGCVIYQDRNGVLHIEHRVYNSPDYDISKFNSFSKPDLSLSKPLKQVEVPCYSYSIAEQTTELYKGAVLINGTTDVIVTYSSSAVNVVASVSGGTLNSATYYANVCVLNITGNGEVTIVANGYSLKSSSLKTTTVYDIEGETVTVDNPLITSQERALAIGKWVGDYMKNRIVLSSSWRADPRLDALDVVNSENDYGTNEVLVTNVNYEYKGSFKGTSEGRVV